MKKNIFLLYFILCHFLHAYDTITELYLRSYKSKTNEQFTPDAKVIIDDSESNDYNLNLEFAANDESLILDVAKVKFYFNNTDLEVGRNRVGWGVGSNFNPSDIFNSKSFDSAFDPFFRKEGRDSIILTNYFENSNFQSIYAFKKTKTIQDQNDIKSSDYGFKFKKNLNDFDLEILYISKGDHNRFTQYYEKKDNLYGVNIKGNISIIDFGIWNELVYSNSHEEFGTAFGIDTYFSEKFYFNLEYYRNYTGENQKENYDFSLIELQENVGKNYLIPSFSIEFHEKLTTYTYAMINIDDSSFIIGDSMEYYFNDIITLNLALFYQFGEKNSEYGYYKEQFGPVNLGSSIRAIF